MEVDGIEHGSMPSSWRRALVGSNTPTYEKPFYGDTTQQYRPQSSNVMGSFQTMLYWPLRSICQSIALDSSLHRISEVSYPVKCGVYHLKIRLKCDCKGLELGIAFSVELGKFENMPTPCFLQ